MTAISSGIPIPTLKPSDGAEKIHSVVLEYGCVIIQDFFSNEEVEELLRETSIALECSDTTNLKHSTNLVQSSPTFRQNVLDKDFLYEILDINFAADNKAYWLAFATGVQAQPTSHPEVLRREQDSFRAFRHLGAAATDTSLKFVAALTPFTRENGATRVVPGSNNWSNFRKTPSIEDEVPAIMNPGDALLLSGKTLHGAGKNNSTDVRHGIGFSFCLGYLTPREAYPFQIGLETVSTMSKRAQRSVGFRSQYPKSGGSVWQVNYAEVAYWLKLETPHDGAQIIPVTQ